MSANQKTDSFRKFEYWRMTRSKNSKVYLRLEKTHGAAVKTRLRIFKPLFYM